MNIFSNPLFKIRRFSKAAVGLLSSLAMVSTANGQTPVSSYTISNQVASPKTAQLNVPGYPVLSAFHFETASDYNLYFAQKNGGANGNSRNVTGFMAGGVSFGPYNAQTGENSFTKVVFNRKEPGIALGDKYTALYEYSSIHNIEGQQINNPVDQYPLPGKSSVYFDPSLESTMEGFMNSYSLNKGTDNVFVNDTNVNTYNNIERIDLIYSNSVIATTEANRNRVGFLINERGGNDNFSVAAITSIDANNNVTGLGPIQRFDSSVWGKVGPDINTVVVQKDSSSPAYRPSQIIASQTVSGVFISLVALDIPANSKIYGIALFPEDVGNDLLGLSDANTNTLSESGLDLMSGNFAAKDITLIYASLSGTVFHDPNGLNPNPVNTVDGIGIGSPGSSQLYANLLDENNIVVMTVPVSNSNGIYQFTNVSPGNYTVQISTLSGIVLEEAPEAVLPVGWANTGESNNGLGTLSDGIPNGLTTVTVENVNVNNINFGIQQLPDSRNLYTTISKPAIGDFILLNGGSNPPVLQGSDPEDLPVESELTGRSVQITLSPSNSELYYDFGTGSVLVADGAVINSFDPSKLRVKITDATAGDSETSFEYAFIDAAGYVDPTPALYVLNWGSPLPVTLSRFDVVNEQGVIRVLWQTTSESNSSYFQLEHSQGGRQWTKLASVAAHGESENFKDYHYTHKSPSAGSNYYRLKMIDQDNSHAYSSVRQASMGTPGHVLLYPNPTSDYLFLDDSILEGGVSIEILSMEGISRYKSSITANKRIDVSTFGTGYYMLKVMKLDGSHIVKKFVVAR